VLRGRRKSDISDIAYSSAFHTQRPPLDLASSARNSACAAFSAAVACTITSGSLGRCMRASHCCAPRPAHAPIIERQQALATGHRQVDIREDTRIEQRAVQLAMRIVDVVALAQCVEAVALTRMALAREQQRIDHAAQLADHDRFAPASSANSRSRRPHRKAAL